MNTGGADTIASNALEASTVDLAREFGDLITTQRARSAATRIITTAHQMLQELMQTKQ
jgi:flagellar hook protein FlgE